MAEQKLAAAYEFHGMDDSSRGTSSSAVNFVDVARKRNPLEMPREIRNFVPTSRGGLWYPPAYEAFKDMASDITGSETIRKIYQAQTGGDWWWVVLDTGGNLHTCRADTLVDQNATTPSTTWPVALPSGGNANPTSPGATIVPVFDGAATDWKLSYSNYDIVYELKGSTDTTNYVGAGSGAGVNLARVSKTIAGGPGTAVPFGPCQAWWNGRRFTGPTPNFDGTSSRIWFQDDINTPWQVSSTTMYLDLGSLAPRGTSPFITCLWPYNDALYAHTQGGEIFVVRGSSFDSISDPGNVFSIERLNTNASSSAPYSIAEWNGLLFFFCGWRGKEGVYMFDGNSATLISGKINKYFTSKWADLVPINFIDQSIELVIHDGLLVLSNPALANNTSYQIYVADLREDPSDPKWSIFGGFSSSTAGQHVCFYQNDASTAVMGSGPVVYAKSPMYIGYEDEIKKADYLFARETDENGYIDFGYEDLQTPHIDKRFLSLKVIAWSGQGTGDPTLKATFTVPDGTTRNSTLNIAASDYNSDAELVYPINLRGPSVRIELEINPGNDDEEVTVEGVELVYTQKGGKTGDLD